MADTGEMLQKSYDVLRNGRGELCVIIDHRPTEPQNPVIGFSGADAYLERSQGENIFMPAFPERFLADARKLQTILIVEVEGILPDELASMADLPKHRISRVYDATVRQD